MTRPGKYTQGGRVVEAHLRDLEAAAGRWPRPWSMGVSSFVMAALISELRELRGKVADCEARDRWEDEGGTTT